MLRTTFRATSSNLRPLPLQYLRLSSTSSASNPSQPDNATQTSTKASETKAPESQEPPKKKKTIAQLDEELRQKMSGLAGDGGEAGVELENGQPVSMKRSVRENMFRYI